MATVRHKEKPELLGSASRFNIHGIGAIFVCWRDGDMSEEMGRNLEVEIDGEWKPLTDAFKDHDLITDNHNTRFFKPPTPEDRERGYTL